MSDQCSRGQIDRFVSPDEWTKVVCALLEDEYCCMLPRFVIVGEDAIGELSVRRRDGRHG